MNTQIWIILACFMVGSLSVLMAVLFLWLPKKVHDFSIPHLVSFATGTLLGAAFIALLPHALEYTDKVDSHHVTITVLIGILGFFLLEKMVLWHHCHNHECAVHDPAHANAKVTAPIILMGESTHNLIHGILISAAFIADTDLGIVTSLAVAAHQIPQELSNFAVLLHTGYSRAKALSYNILSSLVAVAGGIIGYQGLTSMSWLIPYMLAIAASSCIYIAVSDLIPDLHKRAQPSATVQQIILISLGLWVIFITHELLH